MSWANEWPHTRSRLTVRYGMDSGSFDSETLPDPELPDGFEIQVEFLVGTHRFRDGTEVEIAECDWRVIGPDREPATRSFYRRQALLRAIQRGEWLKGRSPKGEEGAQAPQAGADSVSAPAEHASGWQQDGTISLTDDQRSTTMGT